MDIWIQHKRRRTNLIHEFYEQQNQVDHYLQSLPCALTMEVLCKNQGLTFRTMNKTSVFLWLPPIMYIGRDDIFEEIICEQYSYAMAGYSMVPRKILYITVFDLAPAWVIKYRVSKNLMVNYYNIHWFLDEFRVLTNQY